MCTMIAEKVPMSGSAKGPHGWFVIDQVYVGYDHPVHEPLDHAVGIDFVAEDQLGARVGVELSRDAARNLALRILATVDAADAYESAST